jgi:hypothetical protein
VRLAVAVTFTLTYSIPRLIPEVKRMSSKSMQILGGLVY